MPTRYTRIIKCIIAATTMALAAGCGTAEPTISPALQTKATIPSTVTPTATDIATLPSPSSTVTMTTTPTPSPTMKLTATPAWDGGNVLWGIPDTAQASDAGVTVGLYDDDGAAPACVTAAQAMFQWMGYSVELIDADTINDDDISHLNLLYFAGGSVSPYQRDISAAGKEKIRQHISAGGCFIGTCAGALFAAERIVWNGHVDNRSSLELFPGTIEGPIPEIFADPEYGMCQVNLKAHTITGAEPDAAWILYYNGPFFEANPDASVDVIGTYEISGRAALVAFEYDQGRVFLTGPHPEWEEDATRDGVAYFDHFEDQGSDWELMRNASRWCLGTEP